MWLRKIFDVFNHATILYAEKMIKDKNWRNNLIQIQNNQNKMLFKLFVNLNEFH